MGTAEFLADQGKTVEVLISRNKAGPDLETITRYHLLYRLNRKKIVLTSGSRVEALQGKTVIASKSGIEYRIDEVDAVVLSLGSASNDELLRSLSGVKNIHSIGQCRRQVGGLLESISDGLTAAIEI